MQQLLAQHRELLSQPTQSPVPYLTHAIDGFLAQLTVLYTLKNELAAVAPPDGRGGARAVAGSLQKLPDVLRSMHEFLIQVAARVARLRDASGRMRQAHLQACALLTACTCTSMVVQASLLPFSGQYNG